MSGFLFHNGCIETMVTAKSMQGHPQSITAECLITQGEKISFVGTRDKADNWIAAQNISVQTIDLNGACLLPGFIDAHMHPLPMIFFEMSANLEHVHNIAEIQAILMTQSKRVSDEEWVVGVQFEDKRLPNHEALTRTELDAIISDRPVLIYGRDGHCVTVNTKGLEAAGVNEDTINPQGGSLGYGEDGKLDGRFYEKAVGIPLSHMPPPSPLRMLEHSQSCFETLARNGITSIGTMLQSDEEGPGGASAQLETFVIQALRDQIPQSIYGIIIGKTLDGIKATIDSALNDPTKHTTTRAFKIFADGTFGSCTACMTEPYADKTCTHGYMTLDDEEIYRRMEAAHLADYQICVHAIGDQGIKNCVDLFEKLLTEHPKNDHRHRIEHASMADKPLIKRIAKLGLQICTQPLFIRSEKSWLPTRLGPERSGMAYPFRDYFNAGIALAGSSDAPIETPDIIASIDYAVNRGGFHPEQGVTQLEAIQMFTKNAAFIQFEEDTKGTLETGKMADLVILDQNPLTIAKDELGNITVQQTMIRGDFITPQTP